MAHAVMLKPGWPGGIFHRSVRDKDNKILKTLEFQKERPLLLNDAEFAAVKADLDISLVMAHVDSDGVPTGKAATKKAVTAKAPVASRGKAATNVQPPLKTGTEEVESVVETAPAEKPSKVESSPPRPDIERK